MNTIKRRGSWCGYWNWRCLFKPFGARVVFFHDSQLDSSGYRFLRKTPLGYEIKLTSGYTVKFGGRIGLEAVEI